MTIRYFPETVLIFLLQADPSVSGSPYVEVGESPRREAPLVGYVGFCRLTVGWEKREGGRGTKRGFREGVREMGTKDTGETRK